MIITLNFPSFGAYGPLGIMVSTPLGKLAAWIWVTSVTNPRDFALQHLGFGPLNDEPAACSVPLSPTLAPFASLRYLLTKSPYNYGSRVSCTSHDGFACNDSNLPKQGRNIPLGQLVIGDVYPSQMEACSVLHHLCRGH